MDYRLKVFIEAARTLNFTKAAERLFISQPAVSKNIKELETEYGCRFFERHNGNLVLTIEGERMLSYADEILNIYAQAKDDLNILKGKFAGEIKIAASTTIAQYVLPKVIATFLKSYPDVKITLFNVNSSEVVRMLESGSVDIGMVEGNHKSMNLKYSSFKRDELVVVTSVSSDLYDGNISLDDFVKLPLVLRENGSGTLEILYKELMERGIKVNDLNILAQISTTEGIKNFLYAYKNAYAVLPVSGIVRELKHNMLKIIDVDSLQMNRDFYMVERYGSPKLNILSKFITFCY